MCEASFDLWMRIRFIAELDARDTTLGNLILKDRTGEFVEDVVLSDQSDCCFT